MTIYFPNTQGKILVMNDICKMLDNLGVRYSINFAREGGEEARYRLNIFSSDTELLANCDYLSNFDYG